MKDGRQSCVYRSQLLALALSLLMVCCQLQTMLPKTINDAVTVKETASSGVGKVPHEDFMRDAANLRDYNSVVGAAAEKEDEPTTALQIAEKEPLIPSKRDEGQYLPSMIDPQKDRRIIYLHLGKTGGTSLDTRFRSNCQWYNNRQIQTRCFDNLREDTKLSELVINTFHMSMRAFNRKYLNHNSEEKSYLISIRNPIARIVSAFNYEHPKNKGWGPPVQRNFYNNCFDTFPKLMNGVSNGTATDCSETAIQVLRGEGPHQISGHMYWNLYHHASYIPETSEVFVIRTENLWDDFNDLDRQLGGNATVENHKADYGSSNFVVKSGVSFPDGSPEMIQLCCILQVETSTYQTVLLRALNLNEQQKQQTLDVVYRQCGADIESEGNPVDWSRWARRNQCKEEYATVKSIDK